MKAIKSDTDILEFEKIFNHSIAHQSPFVIWQVQDSGERKIYQTILSSFHVLSGQMYFKSTAEETFVANHPLYFYSEIGQFIFKSQEFSIIVDDLMVKIPNEIKFLEESGVITIRGQIGLDISETWKTKHFGPKVETKKMSERTGRDRDFLNKEFDSISLDEEDELFEVVRATPRAKPKLDKWVKVSVGDNPEIHLVRLYDLSQGGIGFITSEAYLFPKGASLKVLGFDEFDLDDPLIGQIVSERPTDDSMAEYKIGVRFSEGQD